MFDDIYCISSKYEMKQDRTFSDLGRMAFYVGSQDCACLERWITIQSHVKNVHGHADRRGCCSDADPDSVVLGQGLRLCISNALPGGLGPHWERYWGCPSPRVDGPLGVSCSSINSTISSRLWLFCLLVSTRQNSLSLHKATLYNAFWENKCN